MLSQEEINAIKDRYQAQYVAEHALDYSWYLAGDPRMGKTRAEVLAHVRRVHEKNVRKTLILAPRQGLTLAWEPELRRIGYERPSLGGGAFGYLLPLQYQVPDKAKFVSRVLIDLLDGKGSDRPCVVLLNYDLLERTWNESKTIRISDLLCKWQPHEVIADEAHYIKTAGAGRSRALRRLGNRAYYRRCLSGTPDPNGHIDFYAQFVFLEPKLLGTNKSKFLEKYFVINPFVANRIERTREETIPELESKVFSIMTRWRAKDYFGDVPQTELTRHIPWIVSARKVYDKLAQKSVLNEREDEITVDGTHLLTKALRFAQLAEGYLEDEATGNVRWLHHSKVAAIVGDLDEILSAGKRAVVSYLHTPMGQALTEAISKQYGHGSVELCSGQSDNVNEKLALFDVNNGIPTPVKVLVVQESIGGVSISLARAEHLLFASWSLDGAAHEQMRKRVWDPARPATIAYYQMQNCVDSFRRKVVKDKREASVMIREIPWFNVIYGSAE